MRLVLQPCPTTGARPRRSRPPGRLLQDAVEVGRPLAGLAARFAQQHLGARGQLGPGVFADQKSARRPWYRPRNERVQAPSPRPRSMRLSPTRSKLFLDSGTPGHSGTPGAWDPRGPGGSEARGLGRKEGSAVWPGLRPPPASERDDRPPAPLLASSGRAGAGRSAASAAQGATPPSQIRSTVHWPGVPTPRISTPKKRNRPAARHCATPGDRHIPVSILACSWRPAPNGSDPGVLPRPYTVASLPVSAFPPVWAWRLPSWRPSLQAPSPRPLRSGPDSVRPSSNRFPSPAPAPRRS